jgi:beta-lactamase class A
MNEVRNFGFVGSPEVWYYWSFYPMIDSWKYFGKNMFRWKDSVSAVIIGVTTMNTFLLPVVAQPFTADVIAAKANKFVVRVGGSGSAGSGFIIRKIDNRYTILTNRHVVKSSTQYTITTFDNQSYTAKEIRFINDIDLAEVDFESNRKYEVAPLSIDTSYSQGSKVYAYGWNAVSSSLTERNGQLLEGTIAGSLSQGRNGYTLTMNLANVPGMSGCPLLNGQGKVIGIYGRSDVQEQQETGVLFTTLALGIPISMHSKFSNVVIERRNAQETRISPAPSTTYENNHPSVGSANEDEAAFKDKVLASLPKGRELTGLRSQLKSLMSDYSFLSPGMFFIDVETGDYVDIEGSKVFPAASTIKLPVLLALFEAVDAGRVRLDETLVVTNALIASGSGNLQYYRGAKLSVLATATKMITISDNTATNMIVKRLGGLAAVNERFRRWGLENTYMKNYMGDFNGTNKTSAIDLVRVSALIAKSMIITSESRQKVLDILNASENRQMLRAGLGEGAHIAHKTGDIGFVIGDAGIIEKPSGKLYLAGVLVRRPYNDTRGRDFVQKVSRITYNYFNSSINADYQVTVLMAGNVNDRP